jgi:hypothetical protein
MPGVATADAVNSEQRAFNSAITFDRCLGVLGTTGKKSAIAAKQGTQGVVVQGE